MTSTLEMTAAAARASVERRHFGHVAVLASGVVGFGLGVLVAAAFIPFVSTPHKHHGTHPYVPPPVPYSEATLRLKVQSLANGALGKYGEPGPYYGRYRLLSVTLKQVRLLRFPGIADTPLFNLTVRFLAEPNAVGTKFQIGEAETDCFLTLQALYDDNLPLEDVELYGVFRFPGERSEQVVLHAGSDSTVEYGLAPWKSLSRGDYGKVWARLNPNWISPRFRTYKAA